MADDQDDDTKQALATLGTGAAAHEFYKDAIQPSAKIVGPELARVIRTALLPVRMAVWGAETIEAWLTEALALRLSNVPPEDIQGPSKHVAGQVMMQLMFCAEEQHLRELYANLLAAAMNKGTATAAHPAFVQVIQQLSPSEALLLRSFTTAQFDKEHWENQHDLGCFMQRQEINYGRFRWLSQLCGMEDAAIPAAIDNLIRLRLIAESARSSLPAMLDMNYAHGVNLTAFGEQFFGVCIQPPIAVPTPESDSAA